MRRIVLAILSLLMTGCASVRLLEIDVRALSTLTAPDLADNASYRIERLLSQDAQPQAQAEIEAIAERSLAAVPLRRAADPLLARYSLQITAQTLAYVLDDEDRLAPFGYGHTQISLGVGGYSGPLRFVYPKVFLRYLYRSEVSLVLRDLRSMKVVYESGARHEGPWPDRAHIYASMFDAALRDFPLPTSGSKRVRIEVPR